MTKSIFNNTFPNDTFIWTFPFYAGKLWWDFSQDFFDDFSCAFKSRVPQFYSDLRRLDIERSACNTQLCPWTRRSALGVPQGKSRHSVCSERMRSAFNKIITKTWWRSPVVYTGVWYRAWICHRNPIKNPFSKLLFMLHCKTVAIHGGRRELARREAPEASDSCARASRACLP